MCAHTHTALDLKAPTTSAAVRRNQNAISPQIKFRRLLAHTNKTIHKHWCVRVIQMGYHASANTTQHNGARRTRAHTHTILFICALWWPPSGTRTHACERARIYLIIANVHNKSRHPTAVAAAVPCHMCVCACVRVCKRECVGPDCVCVCVFAHGRAPISTEQIN